MGPLSMQSDRYALAAHVYDLAAAVWTGGAIWRTRRFAAEDASSGSTIVVAGGGTGRDAMHAARRGVRVILVDRSPAMLARARRRLARDPLASSRVELVEADLFSWRPTEPVDGVLAAHILNVYDDAEMRALRNRFFEWLRPGGKLWIADFAPVCAPGPLGWPQRFAHWLPLYGCALLTGNTRHAIHDHGAELEADGVAASHVHDERVFLVGPRWFRTWTFVRPRIGVATVATGSACSGH